MKNFTIFILILLSFFACKVKQEKELAHHPDTLLQCHDEKKAKYKRGLININGFIEEIPPCVVEKISSDNICWGDTFKAMIICQKRVYDSIKISQNKGTMLKTADSIYIISVPTNDIIFLGNEYSKDEQFAVVGEVYLDGRAKSYLYTFHFNVSKVL